MRIKDFVNTRSLKYGTNSLILIAIVAALVIFLNMLVSALNIKWDTTPTKLYTLTNTTKGIVANLQYNIRITYLADETILKSDTYSKQVLDVLANYKQASPENIAVNFLDPDRFPNLKLELGLEEVFNPVSGNIVVQSLDKISGALIKSKIINGLTDLFETTTETATGAPRVIGIKAEQMITGAINYVTSDYTPVIYFATGHDELLVDKDFTKLAAFIRNSNYDIKSIDLKTAAEIPSDCEAIVFISPQTDLTPGERELLRSWMQVGGRALFLFDTPSRDIDYSNFEDIMSQFNIKLNKDLVVETSSKNYVANYPASIVMTPQSGTFMTLSNKTLVTLGTRSLNILKNKQEDLTQTILLKSSDTSLGKQFDKSPDTKGPFTIAAYTEYLIKDKPSRVAVFGNSLFAMDDATKKFGSYGVDVLYNTVKWLTGSDSTQVNQTIDTKYYGRRLLDISASTANVLAIAMSAVVPLLIFLLGLYVWLKRRHL